MQWLCVDVCVELCVCVHACGRVHVEYGRVGWYMFAYMQRSIDKPVANG